MAVVQLTGVIGKRKTFSRLLNIETTKDIDLSSNRLTSIDLTPLCALPNFKTLNLSNNRLTSIDLTPLRQCNELENLRLESNQLPQINLSPLENCTKLQVLYLQNNLIKRFDLHSLIGLQKLQVLNISNNHCTSIDLAPLKNCIQLKKLICLELPIKELDVTPLGHCINLKSLDIDNSVYLTWIRESRHDNSDSTNPLSRILIKSRNLFKIIRPREPKNDEPNSSQSDPSLTHWKTNVKQKSVETKKGFTSRASLSILENFKKNREQFERVLDSNSDSESLDDIFLNITSEEFWILDQLIPSSNYKLNIRDLILQGKKQGFNLGKSVMDLIHKDICRSTSGCLQLAMIEAYHAFKLRLGIITVNGFKTDGAPFVKKISIETSELSFAGVQLKELNLSPISNLPNLKYLSISFNSLEKIDLSPISSCEKLEELVLWGNKIHRINLNPLKELPNFKILDLSKNRLGKIDLKPLSKCISLQTVSFFDNPVKEVDVTPLFYCEKLLDIISGKNISLFLQKQKYPNAMPKGIRIHISQIKWLKPESIQNLQNAIVNQEFKEHSNFMAQNLSVKERKYLKNINLTFFLYLAHKWIGIEEIISKDGAIGEIHRFLDYFKFPRYKKKYDTDKLEWFFCPFNTQNNQDKIPISSLLDKTKPHQWGCENNNSFRKQCNEKQCIYYNSKDSLECNRHFPNIWIKEGTKYKFTLNYASFILQYVLLKWKIDLNVLLKLFYQKDTKESFIQFFNDFNYRTLEEISTLFSGSLVSYFMKKAVTSELTKLNLIDDKPQVIQSSGEELYSQSTGSNLPEAEILAQEIVEQKFVISIPIIGTLIDGSTFSMDVPEESKEVDLGNYSLIKIDLSPLKKCTKLRKLWLYGNELSEIDLSPLNHCHQLTELSLSKNILKAVDLSFADSCPKLTRLWIYSNNLSKIDLTPLSNCKNLKKIWLDNNNFKELDLSPLKSCKKLHEVTLRGNNFDVLNISSILTQIPSLKILVEDSVKLNGKMNVSAKTSKAPIKSLIFNREHVGSKTESMIQKEPSEVSTKKYYLLEGKTTGNRDFRATIDQESQEIHLNEQNLVEIDLSVIKSITNLSRISLAGNNLKSIDLTPIKYNSDLKTLDLSRNQLYELNLFDVQYCYNLETVLLYSNLLSNLDLSPFKYCINLQYVDLSENQLNYVTLSPLKGNQTLNSINLSSNHLQDIDLNPLQSCASLQKIALAQNKINQIDLSPLDSCTRLTTLDLYKNRLLEIDLSPLQSCKSLISIDFSENKLRQVDITPLLGCKNLQEIWVDKEVNLTLTRWPNKDEISPGLEKILKRIHSSK